MSQDLIAALRHEIEEKHAAFERELEELRRKIGAQEISAQQAHERIGQLEQALTDLKKETKRIGDAVAEFSPKLDKFMDNLWKAFFLLIFIVAALVGIKLF